MGSCIQRNVNIKLITKTLRQNNNIVYLVGAMCSDGRSEVEMRRKVQAVSNAWRQAEGVMVDRAISRQLHGNLLGARK